MRQTTMKLVANIPPGLKILAVYEGLGGVVGIGRLLVFPPAQTRIGALSFFCVLYGVSMLAGWWLWKGEQRGITLSKFLWAGQILGLIIGTMGWKFVSGLGVTLVFMFHGDGFSIHMALEMSRCLLQYPLVISLEINLAALLILMYVFRATKRLSWRVVEPGASPPAQDTPESAS